MSKINYEDYYKKVKKDIEELKQEYPYTKVILIPTTVPSPLELVVVAVNRELIKACRSKEADFTGEYSRKVRVVIPFDYQNCGCDIWGAEWLEIDKIPQKDRHFYGHDNSLYQFCIGVPQSFKNLENVILENVRTAENMLVAYENFQKGRTKRVELIAYSHGEAGEKEYDKNKHSYKTR